MRLTYRLLSVVSAFVLFPILPGVAWSQTLPCIELTNCVIDQPPPSEPPPNQPPPTEPPPAPTPPQGPLGFSDIGEGQTGMLVQLGSTSDLLLGFGSAPTQGSGAGALAAAGSVTLGARGFTPVGNLAVYGAVGYLKQDEGALTLNHGVMLTGVARYSFDSGNPNRRPFLDFGAWAVPSMGLSIDRPYTSGGTGYTGTGDPNGNAMALFLRGGMLITGAPGHSVELVAGVERYRLRADAYSETASASNPLPANVAASSIYGTQAKLSVQVTTPLGKRGDGSVALGIGRAWFNGNVAGTVSGFSFAGGAQDTTFAQVVLRAGWLVGQRSRFDVFATSTAGSHIATHSSAGVAWTWLF